MKKLFLVCGGLSGVCPTLRLDLQSDISLQNRWVYTQEIRNSVEGAKVWQDTPYEWRGRDLVGMPMQSYVAPQALSDREILLSSLGVGVQVLDTVYQKILWNFEIPIGVASVPYIDGAFVYVAGMDSKLYKLNWKEKKVVWKQDLPAESTGGIRFAKNSQILVSTADDAVHSVSMDDGKIIWTYRRTRADVSHLWSLRGQAQPVFVEDGELVVLGFSDGFLVGVDFNTGKLRWEKNLEVRGLYKDVDTSMVYLKNSKRLVASLPSGDVLALEPKTGKTLWRVAGGGAFAPLLSQDEKFLYLGSLDARLLKLDSQDGSLIWQLPLQKRGLASTPASLSSKGKEMLVVNTSHGGTLLVQESDGKILWENSSLTGTLAPPAVLGRDVWVLSSRNILSRYQLIGNSAN